MVSERVQRRIDRLLDEAEAAADAQDWTLVADSARRVLVADPGNSDATTFLAMAEASEDGEAAPASAEAAPEPSPTQAAPVPTSFAGGRYEVKRFLGEGGKKRVYLAHDTTLDRDVAFALIKTEGFDDISRRLGLTRR